LVSSAWVVTHISAKIIPKFINKERKQMSLDTTRILSVCSSKSCDSPVRKPTKRTDTNTYRYYTTCQQCNKYSSRYGLSKQEVTVLKEKQENKCALCDIELVWGNTEANSAAIDHCHSTGKIRGLLCFHCNRALGMFKDSTDTLTKAIKYLEANK